MIKRLIAFVLCSASMAVAQLDYAFTDGSNLYYYAGTTNLQVPISPLVVSNLNIDGDLALDAGSSISIGGTNATSASGWFTEGLFTGTNVTAQDVFVLDNQLGSRKGPYEILTRPCEGTNEWENMTYQVIDGVPSLVAPGFYTQILSQIDFAVTNDRQDITIRLDPSSGSTSPSEQWYNDWYGFAFIGILDKEMLASARVPQDADIDEEFDLEFAWVESKTGSGSNVVFEVQVKYITASTNQSVDIAWAATSIFTNTAFNTLGTSHEVSIDISDENIQDGDRIMIRFARDTTVADNWSGTANVSKNTNLRYRKKR